MAEAQRREGPIHDRMMRYVVESDFEAFSVVSGLPVGGAPDFVSTTIPARSPTLDLLVRTAPGRYLHGEYVRTPTWEDAPKILEYRAAIMRKYRWARIVQLAVVMGDGHLKLGDDPETGFAQGVRIVYLRDIDPADLLSSPGLAPMAVLGRGNRDGRVRAFSAAIQLINGQPDDRRFGLLQAAMTFAKIRLDPGTIYDELRKATHMSVEEIAEFYRDTEFSKLLEQRALVKGVEQGRHELAVQSLLDSLCDRFGDRSDLPELAERLAQAGPLHQMIASVLRADTLDDLDNRQAGEGSGH